MPDRPDENQATHSVPIPPDREIETAPAEEGTSASPTGVALSEADYNRLKHGRRVTDEVRDKMYADWKAGTPRATNTLARKYGISFVTARRIIVQGNASRGWQPFKVMLALESETVKKAEAAAEEKITETLVDEWQKARGQDLTLLQAQKSLLARLLKQFKENLEAITFGSTYYDKNGEAHEVPVTWSEAVGSASRLAQATEILVKAESLLMGKPTERKDVNVTDPWEKLTPEQCRQIAETGQLPDGVTEEELFGKPRKASN